MATKIGSFTAGAAGSRVLEEDMHRSEVMIEWYSGGDIHIAFGEAALAGKGIRLSAGCPAVVVNDHRARLEVRVIRGAAVDGLGGYAVA